MTINKEHADKLAEYGFKLVIEHNTDKDLINVIEFSGKDHLERIFNEESLINMAKGLKIGEDQFYQYKKEGFIKKDKNGEWNLGDAQAQEIAKNSEGVVVDNNEPSSIVQHVKNKEDLKGGKID